MRILRRTELTFKEIPWVGSGCFAGLIDPTAASFCRELMSGGHQPEDHIKLLPKHGLLYVAVPKAASTRIRITLARIEGRFSRSLRSSKRCNYRGPYGPRNMTMISFYDIVASPATLRFSFVRNPYARMVSSWADKFAGNPLLPVAHFIYYCLRAGDAANPRLPLGPGRSLTFADFVRFVGDLPSARRDSHVQAQSAILDIPRLRYTFIGRVETFDTDFARVLDFLNVSHAVRREASKPINQSHQKDRTTTSTTDCTTYYPPELANRVYRAYESDFDNYAYPRTLPNAAFVAVRLGAPELLPLP